MLMTGSINQYVHERINQTCSQNINSNFIVIIGFIYELIHKIVFKINSFMNRIRNDFFKSNIESINNITFHFETLSIMLFFLMHIFKITKKNHKYYITSNKFDSIVMIIKIIEEH